MVSIGFRVSPSKVTYALVQKTADGFTLVDASAVFIPPALETPRQLQFIRTTLLDVMDEYAVTRAGLRLAEGLAQRRNPFRLNLEGVVQELLASSSVERFVAGPIATMASLLGHGADRAIVKKLIQGEVTPEYAINWRSLSEDEREAVLMAVAAASANVQSSMTVTGAVATRGARK
jgi:hypothetical protein